MIKLINLYILGSLLILQCHKPNIDTSVDVKPRDLDIKRILIDSNPVSWSELIHGVRVNAQFFIEFTNAVDKPTVSSAISLTSKQNKAVPLQIVYLNKDSVLQIIPQVVLDPLDQYQLAIKTGVKSVHLSTLKRETKLDFITEIDHTYKFPMLTDSALLDLVQKQTFRFFWDFGHPMSGYARERSNSTPETVTTGGTGFGIMSILVGIHRKFITKQEGLDRIKKIVAFTNNSVDKFHGAVPHWVNGTTGKVIPFSTKDDGADLVETSYLAAGLLAAREFFKGNDTIEVHLRMAIDKFWKGIEWNYFTQNNQPVLYWHFSPRFGWEMNHKIQGWNECLITYILAASSPEHAITKSVYQEGFARKGAMVNGQSYYGYVLPLGPSNGGPLFWAHYSFLGINPYGLKDDYANYQTQVINHSRINYAYCKSNPRNYFGYSEECWGLTASDIPNGYTASEPNNDVGVISPTAALSSLPYTPTESMKAMRYFYYVLGNKIWTEYGFRDAFSLEKLWYADSHLAIDQGPIIVMIENHRSGLIWNLVSNCPEIKKGMKNVLGFSAPYLN